MRSITDKRCERATVGSWWKWREKDSSPLTWNLEHQRGTNTESTGYPKAMCSESTARCSKAAHSIGRNTTSAKRDSDFPVDGHHPWQRIGDRGYWTGKNPGVIIQSFNTGILAVCYVIGVVLDVGGILIPERCCHQRTWFIGNSKPARDPWSWASNQFSLAKGQKPTFRSEFPSLDSDRLQNK